jgi:hypothetical protein
MSPRPVPPRASRSYKERPVVGPGGDVRSAGVEPASTWPSTMPVYQIAARAHGASGRSRTACLSLTRGPLCRVSYRGVAAHRGFEPRLTDPESAVLPIERMGIGC